MSSLGRSRVIPRGRALRLKGISGWVSMRCLMTLRLSLELADFLEGGVSMGVGARDAQGWPEAARAMGARVSADRRAVTVFLAEPVAARLVPCFEVNPVIAVTFNRILDHRTVQLKGRVVGVASAKEEDRELLLGYLAAFAEQVSMVGLPRSVIRRIRYFPAVGITFEVDAVFEQTPGPGAGEPMEAGR